MLQQEYNKTLTIDNLHLNTHNPPRRDVVLLPGNGFVVIAFKTDNPGSWYVLLLCFKRGVWTWHFFANTAFQDHALPHCCPCLVGSCVADSGEASRCQQPLAEARHSSQPRHRASGKGLQTMESMAERV